MAKNTSISHDGLGKEEEMGEMMFVISVRYHCLKILKLTNNIATAAFLSNSK